MKKLLVYLFLGLFLFTNFSLLVFAGLSPEFQKAEDEYASERATILPRTDLDVYACKNVMNYVLSHTKDFKNMFKENFNTGSIQGIVANDVLGCGIKTGQIKLWMVAYYIKFLMEFVIKIAGLISVGGIVYGGYLYMFAGISDDKEKGKKAIMYAVAGMVLTMVAWAFVNIVISIVT